MTGSPLVRVLVGIALVVAIIAVADRVGALHGAPVDSSASPLVGRAAPALAGTTVAGAPYRWRPGRVTVVSVWASWCVPCRDEVPLVARFAHRWAGRGVQVVTVDTRDGSAAAQRFLAQVGAGGLVALRDPDGTLAVSWGATGIPETFVVDRRGVIEAHHIGEVDATWLADEVARWT